MSTTNSSPNNMLLRSNAFYELSTVVLCLVLVKQSLLGSSLLLAGPASTLTAMVLASWLLFQTGRSWADLGLRMPSSIVQTLVLSLLVFIVIAICAKTARWLAEFISDPTPLSDRFASVQGNLLVYLGMLVLVWTHGSIFEELLFRAFIIDRTATVFGGSEKAYFAAAILSAIFFGYRHYYYQGLRGAIVTGTIGFGLAILYLRFGRKNIWPLIIGHGAVNTLSQTQRFLG